MTTSIDSLLTIRPTTRPSAPSSRKISVRPSLSSRRSPTTGRAQVEAVSSASTRVPSSKSAARTRTVCRKRCSSVRAALTELGPWIGRSPAGARSGSEREMEGEQGKEVDESSFWACSAGRAGEAGRSATSGEPTTAEQEPTVGRAGEARGVHRVVRGESGAGQEWRSRGGTRRRGLCHPMPASGMTRNPEVRKRMPEDSRPSNSLLPSAPVSDPPLA